MSTISLRLPDSLHEGAKALAQEDEVSLNQFITLALAEKISALGAEKYLEVRRKRASRSKYDRVLRKVKRVPPSTGDERD